MPTLEEMQKLPPEERQQFEDLRVMYGLDENFQPPDLDPELALHVYEEHGMTNIKHPLVFSIAHAPMLNGRVNMQLAAKKKALAEAEAEKNWWEVIYLHERPYRVDTFYGIREELTDEQYWSLLSDIWTDTENMYQNIYTWKLLLESDRPGRSENFMDDEERAALAEMPEDLTIYRGTSYGSSPGMSWTLDRDRAEWFGRRYALMGRGSPEILIAHVHKKDVVGYLSGRNEEEIVVVHDSLHDVKRLILIDIEDQAKGMEV